ncbi:MAG: UDP-N-acetylmuramoyl-L-alanine--D-glutamate ligase [Desulfuromonadales bacterium]|nr:UDP-N-acetylmuramoyl-L-alanine--D-glutamate ligase [Desulfuromonadales bacterium]
MQRDYRNKKIVIIGAGSTGCSLTRFFCAQGAQVTLSDNRSADLLGNFDELAQPGVTLDLGGHTHALFLVADLIVVSPGVPLDIPVLNACREHGVPVLGEIEIAWRELVGTVIAITGINGKSTVTTLVGKMIKAWGQKAFVGGNLGTPLVDAVGHDYNWYVVELSSFQLETIEAFRPRYAMLLNVTEDHLDRYADMAGYLEAKARIFKNLQEDDVVILNADDPLVMQAAAETRANRVYFSSQSALDSGMSLVGNKIIWRWQESEVLFPVDELQIRGQHNQENVMAALIPLLLEGCPAEVAWSAAKRFTGLPHRMEFLGELRGSGWYNDSKGTNIGSVVKSLSGVAKPVVLIAGGKDKQGDLSALVEPIRAKVTHLVLIGAAAERMAEAFAGLTEIHRAGNMHEAVELAARLSSAGTTVMLSPGCSSFDMYKNFEERGHVFSREFRGLTTHGECSHGN